MAQGLLAHWNFNNNSATDIQDFSTNQNHGTSSTLSISTDPLAVGKVGVFSSADFTVTDFSDIDALTAFSILFKFKTTSLASDQVIIDRAGSVTLKLLSTGYISITLTDDTTTDATLAFTGITTLTTNQWYTVVITWSGTSAIIYVDDLDETETKAWGLNPTLDSNANDLYVGSLNDSTLPFVGSMECIAFYNRVFTAAEIQTVMENPSGIKHYASDSRLQTGDLVMNDTGGQEVVTWYEQFDERAFSDGEYHLFNDEEQLLIPN